VAKTDAARTAFPEGYLLCAFTSVYQLIVFVLTECETSNRWSIKCSFQIR